MHDREIVAKIAAGDLGGLAAAYDTYASGLYAYCLTLLTEPADAADAVQDTFVVAAAKVSALRDRDRLRAWLYAVARNECHRRHRGRAALAPMTEGAEPAGEADAPETGEQQAQLRVLVRAALAGLNAGEREIIELHLRRELSGDDLADVLGVSRKQAHALASRARSQFETSLGVLLVARSGRQFCPDLAGILDGWDGTLTVLLRKRLNRHVDRCAVCAERRRRELSPAMLLGLLPVALVPASLRDQIAHLAADTAHGMLASRAKAGQHLQSFTRAGFPSQVSPARAGWGRVGSPGVRARRIRVARVRGRFGQAAAGIAVAGALIGGALLLLPQHSGPPGAAGPRPASPGSSAAAPPTSAPAAAPIPGRSAAPPGTVSPALSRLAAESAQPALSAPGTGPGGPTPAGPTPGGPTPAGSSASAPPPSPSPTPSGTLIVSPTLVQVGVAIRLTAEGGPVSFSITAPAVLAVSPAAGSLQAGASVTVAVRLALGQLLSANVTVIVYPGPTRVIVLPVPLLGALRGA
jgi:RNA polymerase sigma factor (sigma-70 family)